MVILLITDILIVVSDLNNKNIIPILNIFNTEVMFCTDISISVHYDLTYWPLPVNN